MYPANICAIGWILKPKPVIPYWAPKNSMKTKVKTVDSKKPHHGRVDYIKMLARQYSFDISNNDSPS